MRALIAVMGLGLLALTGCQNGTFVRLSLTQAVMTPATTRIELALVLDGATAQTTLGGGAAVFFPSAATLQIGTGSGPLRVTATAYDAQGTAIDGASGTVDVVRDQTATLLLALGGPVADMASQNDLGRVGDLNPDSASPMAPSIPLSVVASSGNAEATVTWNAPASTGGSAITAYTVTPSPAGTPMTTNGTTTNATFTGLTNGTTYTFTVVAQNASGDSPPATSNATTPTATPLAPSAPTAVTATANVDHGATISWTAADNHGSPLQGYAIMFGGGTAILVGAGASATSIVVTGLTPGTSYNFQMTATNSVGTSPTSLVSNNMIAATTPSAAPTNVMATANVDHGATVSWTAPASTSTGFSPLTKYTVTAAPGGATAMTPDGATTTAQVTGLTPGTTYAFTVVASNVIGDGPPSSPSSGVVVVGRLAAPTGVIACGADSQMTVSFNPVAGATSYDVYYNTTTPASAGTKINMGPSPSPIAVTNGTYHVVVAAVNAAGEGTLSTDTTAVASTGVHDTLFAATSTGVDMFDCYSQLPDGTSQPTRSLVIAGGASTVAVDPGNAALFVDNGGCCAGGTIAIWLGATTINGSVGATYSLTEGTGFAAGLGRLAVDASQHKLYVGHADNASPLYRFGYSQVSDLNGSPGAEATFTLSGGSPAQLFVDPASGDL